MEFEVLGPVRLRRDADPAARLGRLQRTLLGLLLLHANRPVSADTLTEALWEGVQDDRVDQNLRLHVHRMRRTLGEAGRLSYSPGGYQLRVLPGELDAERFETLVDEAAQIADQEPERCVDLVRKALGLWRGTPYEGLDFPMLADEAHRLADRRLAATELLFEAELARGRSAAIVGDLTDLVRRHPLREHLQALLMIALYRAGRQADALQVFQDARRTLVDELGLEPGPELRSIEQQVLSGESVEIGRRAETVRPVPAQLPGNVRGFVGRESELTALDRLLDDGGDAVAITVVTGTAGVGKTALALRWSHQAHDEFPDGQLYVDLRGYGPDAPIAADDALAGFLRALGVEGGEIPPDSAERAARFRSLLDGRRMLVVLDNARSVEQVRPLLPGSASCAVLITSRDSLAGLGVREGARRISLDRLSHGEANRLMVELLGEQTVETADLEQLIEQCARLPLALRVAADLVGTRSGRGVAGLVAELADEHDRLDLLDVEEDPHSAVRAVFSWSYQQLPPDSARLFRLCGLHPGRDADLYALTALAGSDRRTTRSAIDRLVRAHLLEELGDGRFQLHDLLRAYAVELAEQVETDADRTASIARLAAHYLYAVSLATDLIDPRGAVRRPEVAEPSTPTPALSTYDQALAWTERGIDSMLATVAVASDDYTTLLSRLLVPYFEIRGRYDEALTLVSRALAIAERNGDAHAEATAHRMLGNVHYYRGDYQASIRQDEAALALCRRLGDRRGEVTCLVNLGATHQRRGNYRTALRCFEQAGDIGADSDHQRLSLLANTGNLQRVLGEYEAARDSLERALDLANTLGDRAGRVIIRCNLGDLDRRTGHPQEAAGHLRSALAEARDSGNRAGESDALCGLGEIYVRLGDLDPARESFRAALDVARALGSRAKIAEALNGLGRSLRSGDEATRAVREHGEALEIATSSGVRYEEAAAQDGLGDAYADLGDLETAREHWERALTIYLDLDIPESDDVRAKLTEPASP
jgi:DNA-binding SARP family transcriptional activator/tetratricopeptide (TPR) repeat protein